MFGIAMYVDNLERVRYDIQLELDNLVADQIILYAGSEQTFSLLQPIKQAYPDVKIVNIGVPVKRPSDIPQAYNASINYSYNVLGITSLLFIEADNYFTKTAMDKFLLALEAHKRMCMIYRHVQLYASLWDTNPGCWLAYKEAPIYGHPNGDGSRFTGATNDMIYDNKDNTSVLDCGYLTIDHYMKKMYNHNFLWPDSYKVKVLDQFRRGKEFGLKMAYMAIRKSMGMVPLEPINPVVYEVLLDKLNAWDEYSMCCEVMREVNGN